MKKTKEENELLSVNEKLYDDLFIQHLEERLETDPLAANGLASMFDNSIDTQCILNFSCEINNCAED